MEPARSCRGSSGPEKSCWAARGQREPALCQVLCPSPFLSISCTPCRQMKLQSAEPVNSHHSTRAGCLDRATFQRQVLGGGQEQLGFAPDDPPGAGSRLASFYFALLCLDQQVMDVHFLAPHWEEAAPTGEQADQAASERGIGEPPCAAAVYLCKAGGEDKQEGMSHCLPLSCEPPRRHIQLVALKRQVVLPFLGKVIE